MIYFLNHSNQLFDLLLPWVFQTQIRPEIPALLNNFLVVFGLGVSCAQYFKVKASPEIDSACVIRGYKVAVLFAFGSHKATFGTEFGIFAQRKGFVVVGFCFGAMVNRI